MVCGGLRWFVVVCGGLWWFVVDCGGLSFSHTPHPLHCRGGGGGHSHTILSRNSSTESVILTAG